MADDLPYAVPARVPKWVPGFPEWLKANGMNDDNIDVMAQTWLHYQQLHWVSFHANGKKRKRKEPVPDAADFGAPLPETVPSFEEAQELPPTPGPEEHSPAEAIPPRVRSRLRKRLARVKELAADPRSSEFRQALAELQTYIDSH